ncbi:MAG TPA: DUF998 domain-containing protein [Candidatus Dormibacteraeota bacterium]|nr:DUF998 domain-containing protein [Candidatus Dormibacteraeota bacterium]
MPRLQCPPSPQCSQLPTTSGLRQGLQAVVTLTEPGSHNGVLTAPLLFAATFTALGSRREGYNWRRDAVSSLAVPPGGRLQQINFVTTGLLFLAAGRQLRDRAAIPGVAARLVQAAGIGLVGSGVWVTDTVPQPLDGSRLPVERLARTRAGRLHDVSAVPIFLGIPAAALVSSVAAARAHAWRWSGSSATGAILRPALFVCFGASYGAAPALAGKGGIFQRLSIGTGFGWVAAACLRGPRSPGADTAS